MGLFKTTTKKIQKWEASNNREKLRDALADEDINIRKSALDSLINISDVDEIKELCLMSANKVKELLSERCKQRLDVMDKRLDILVVAFDYHKQRVDQVKEFMKMGHNVSASHKLNIDQMINSLKQSMTTQGASDLLSANEVINIRNFPISYDTILKESINTILKRSSVSDQKKLFKKLLTEIIISPESFEKHTAIAESITSDGETLSPEPSAGGIEYKGRESTESGTYEIYKATTASQAREFLKTQKVNEKLLYIVVETPEGNWGIDIDGIYLENLLPFQTDLSLAEHKATTNGIPNMSSLKSAEEGIIDNFTVEIKCGGCQHEWIDGLRYQNDTIVKCPKCGKYNSVDSRNFKVITA